MLWGSGTILAGLFLGQTFLKQGMKKMNLGSILSVNEMPYYYFEDADGDQIALPCTERLVSVDTAANVTRQRFMPILAIKGKPEVRLGSFQSLAGKPIAGPWAPVVIAPSDVAAPAAAAPAAAPAAEPRRPRRRKLLPPKQPRLPIRSSMPCWPASAAATPLRPPPPHRRATLPLPVATTWIRRWRHCWPTCNGCFAARSARPHLTARPTVRSCGPAPHEHVAPNLPVWRDRSGGEPIVRRQACPADTFPCTRLAG